MVYVNPSDHVYLSDPEHREEGGTPAIVESIRAGLVFQLKEAVGTEAIREREEAFIRRAIERWEGNPNIEVLGSHSLARLSIVSFVVRHAGRYLHHNYVVALLNDLFGIQSRGGCSCAGPYGHRLLGIDIETSHEFEREISRGCEGIKPGWVRVNFNYFISEAVFEFILEAVERVATDGWRLLPEYRFDPLTGLWTHVGGGRRSPTQPPRCRLRGGFDGLCRASSPGGGDRAGWLPRGRPTDLCATHAGGRRGARFGARGAGLRASSVVLAAVRGRDRAGRRVTAPAAQVRRARRRGSCGVWYGRVVIEARRSGETRPSRTEKPAVQLRA